MALLVLMFVAVVTGQTTPPPKCCVPRQFETNIGQVGGQLYYHDGTQSPVIVDIDNVMHYDYYTSTMVFEVTTHHVDSADVYTKIIMDFKTRTQYIVTNGVCTTSRTRQQFRDPCIPDHAVFLDRSTLGYGNDSIDTVTWQFSQPESGNDVKLTVTSQSCVPVVEAFIGVVNNAPSVLSFLLTDFKPGLRRPAVFQIPDSCKNSNSVVQFENLPLHVQLAVIAMETFVA